MFNHTASSLPINLSFYLSIHLGDSFHLMQQDWKVEIADRLTDIRVKEHVSIGQYSEAMILKIRLESKETRLGSNISLISNLYE